MDRVVLGNQDRWVSGHDRAVVRIAGDVDGVDAVADDAVEGDLDELGWVGRVTIGGIEIDIQISQRGFRPRL